jgi:hypothetical protein
LRTTALPVPAASPAAVTGRCNAQPAWARGPVSRSGGAELQESPARRRRPGRGSKAPAPATRGGGLPERRGALVPAVTARKGPPLAGGGLHRAPPWRFAFVPPKLQSSARAASRRSRIPAGAPAAGWAGSASGAAGKRALITGKRQCRPTPPARPLPRKESLPRRRHSLSPPCSSAITEFSGFRPPARSPTSPR